MFTTDSQEASSRSAGYARLIRLLGNPAIPHCHESVVALSGVHRVDALNGVVRETYPASYWPGELLGDHLEFALKYDGVNLAILASIFAVANASEIAAYIQSKPTGKYARRIWYLYELITGERLPVDDLKRCNYVDLLEPDAYITASPAKRSPRHGINDNLLGDRQFCPITIPHARGGEPQCVGPAPGGNLPIPHARGGEPPPIRSIWMTGTIPHARGGEPR